MKASNLSNKKSIIKIHFVCTGNVFRSRLAEMYLNSKQISNINAFSSGIKADRNRDGPISWYTARLARNQQLVSYLSPHWQKLTKELLQRANITIFMQNYHLKHVKTLFPRINFNYEIWDIPDLVDLGFTPNAISLEDEIERIKKTEEIFSQIQKKIDGLVRRLY